LAADALRTVEVIEPDIVMQIAGALNHPIPVPVLTKVCVLHKSKPHQHPQANYAVIGDNLD